MFTAVLDTCVLFPMYLRDTLLRLAAAGLYQPVWSADILTELQRALVRRGVSTAGAERIIDQMRIHFPSAEVIGYQSLIPAMTCDAKDRHVLAAGVKVGAGALVTETDRTFRHSPSKPSRLRSCRRTSSCSTCWTCRHTL